MDAGLASEEMTTMERCEHLLTVIACALTQKPPRVVCPWSARAYDNAMEALGG